MEFDDEFIFQAARRLSSFFFDGRDVESARRATDAAR
jgi:hypothetical protein